MVNRQDIHNVVEELPASELGAALRYLRFLCYDGLDEEPIDAETVAKLDAARAEGGHAVALDEVKRRYGL